MDAAFGPGLDMNAIGPIAPYAAGAYGHSVPGVPAMMGNMGNSGPAARLASAATSGATHQEWVNQFSGMQLEPGAAGPSAAMRAQAHAATLAPMNQAMNIQQAQFGMPMFGAAAPGMLGFQNPGMNMVAQPQRQAAVAQVSETAVDVDAFNRAFGEYDNADLDAELVNNEFAEAQDKWMAEHGPQVQPPMAAEMQEIDADLEQLAKEQDIKRQSNDDLARAAVDIVNSVADNTSEKFKNSRFFELMRRIGNREVVVEGDGFINATTGEKVSTSHVEDENDDSGIGADSATPDKINGNAPIGTEGQRA